MLFTCSFAEGVTPNFCNRHTSGVAALRRESRARPAGTVNLPTFVVMCSPLVPQAYERGSLIASVIDETRGAQDKRSGCRSNATLRG